MNRVLKTCRLFMVLMFLSIKLFAGTSQNVFDIEDFGAVGDGVFLNTEAIQKAIDTCSKSGGGRVVINQGVFLSGSIYLKDNVTLHLEANSVLLGSPKAAEYMDVGNFVDGLGHSKNRFFIGATDAKNIGIQGQGVINGQGSSPEFRIYKDERGDVRPTLLKFFNCEKVRVLGITLLNSGAWVSHYFGCNDVLIQNVNIDSWSNGNNDGMDIDCCTNVRIDNCNVSSGDDSIVLKATGNRPTRNVVVSNCILQTSTGAFKIGTESVGDIQNVTVSNCAVRGAGGGIKLLCMDGSVMRNINISNMVMQNVEMPIFLRLGSRLNVFHQGEDKKDTGKMENVKISNIQIDSNSPGRTKGHHMKHQTGIFVTGIPGHPIKDLSLENISIRIHGGGDIEDRLVQVPENIAKYPEFNFFSDWLPAFGAYIRHVENVRLENIKIETVQLDHRYAVVADSIKNFTFNNIQADISSESESFYAVKNSINGIITQHFINQEMGAFAIIKGKVSDNIVFAGNHHRHAKRKILLSNEVRKQAVIIK